MMVKDAKQCKGTRLPVNTSKGTRLPVNEASGEQEGSGKTEISYVLCRNRTEIKKS